MPGSWYDLLNGDSSAAATYGFAPKTVTNVNAMPGPKGWLSGLFRLPTYFGNMDQVGEDYFNNADTGFQNSFNRMSGHYQPGVGNSMFYRWLTSGRGMNAAQDAFAQLEASMQAGGRGEQTPTYMDFFRNYDPLAAFNSLSPQERGEDPRAYSPFTRFLTR